MPEAAPLRRRAERPRLLSLRLLGALLALALCAALARAQPADGNAAQELQRANDEFARRKAFLGPWRQDEPARYAASWRSLLERHEATVAKASAVPQSVGARQSLAREYYELGALLRFRLQQPDEAIAAYARASRVQPRDVFDVAALAAADTHRFDKRDSRQALEYYRRGLASLAATAARVPAQRSLADAFRVWIEHEVAYLESGRTFSGAIGRRDMAMAQLWLATAAMQDPGAPARDARALASLPPSQYQLARIWPAIAEYEPAEMLAFFARHDPAGYLTAAILAGARLQAPSPFVNAAADTFFASRGIRAGAAAADPRYASPEKTWTAFIAAAKQGDAAGMLDCFTPGMQASLGELLKRMSRDELRAMGASFVGFAMQGESEAMIVRQQKDRRQAGFVHFVNDGSGWKIESM